MDKLSYALGLGIGQQLAQMGAEGISASDFAQAIDDVLSGKDLKVSHREAQTIVQDYFAKQEQKISAQRAEAGKAHKEAGEKYLAENAKKEGVITLPSGLQYQVLKEGNGKKPSAKDTVMCHYEGFLIDGTGSAGKNDNSLPLRFRHKAQFRFLYGIGCNRQEAQLHTTGHSTRGHAVNHFVEVEVILAVTIFLCLVDIGIDHLRNALDDRCGINVGILDVLLDVLLFIGQEVISIAGSADIVLAHEPVQGLSDLFTEDDLIRADIISHQDNDVVHIGRDVIHITDKV